MAPRPGANKVRVNRLKLIEKLKQKLVDREKRRAAAFEEERKKYIGHLDEELRKQERAVATARENAAAMQAKIAAAKKWKSIGDVPDSVGRYHHFGLSRSGGDDFIEKTIALLEISDEETIDVGPTSDIYSLI